MEPNGHGLLGLAMMAAHPDSWPDWAKQIVAGLVVVFVASFSGASLALWREQGILQAQVAAEVSLARADRHSIQVQINAINREQDEQTANIKRAHDRINAHLEGHQPKAK